MESICSYHSLWAAHNEPAYLHLIDNNHLSRQLESQVDGEEDHPDGGAEGEASDNSKSQHQTSATKISSQTKDI